MQQTSKRQRHTPHLWIVLTAILALAALYPVETLTAHRSSTTVPALEPAFSPPGGYYDQDVQLEIRPPRPDAHVILHPTAVRPPTPVELSTPNPST